jgi:neuronal cell adhesion protein
VYVSVLAITLSIYMPPGQYQCFADNEWGTATSNSVFLRKAELNSFKEEAPSVMEAQEGNPFKLTCQSPNGWPKPNINWLTQVNS